MKHTSDILPLRPNQILVSDGGHYYVKRVGRQEAGGSLTSFTDRIHGQSVAYLKRQGYKFLPATTWPWNAEGSIEGVNPSSPAYLQVTPAQEQVPTEAPTKTSAHESAIVCQRQALEAANEAHAGNSSPARMNFLEARIDEFNALVAVHEARAALASAVAATHAAAVAYGAERIGTGTTTQPV